MTSSSSTAEGNAPLWWRMVFAHFDICLDFTGNDRSALFSILSKATQRIAFEDARKTAARGLFYNYFVDSSVRENHTVDHYMDPPRPLKIDVRLEGIPLHLPEWASKKARQLLEAGAIKSPYIVIHPGSARSEKYWVPERWAEVIDFCQRETGNACLLTGGSDAIWSGSTSTRSRPPSTCPAMT